MRRGLGKWLLRRWLAEHLPQAAARSRASAALPCRSAQLDRAARRARSVRSWRARPAVREICRPDAVRAPVRRSRATSAPAAPPGPCSSTRSGTAATSSGRSCRTMHARRWRKLPSERGGPGRLAARGRGDGAARRQRGRADTAQVDFRHRHIERAATRVGQLVVVAEAAAQPAAPIRACRRWRAIRRPTRGRRAPRRRGPRPAAAAPSAAARCSRRRRTIPRGPAAISGAARSLSDGRDDERGAGQDAQDLGDALARLEERDAARREVGVIGDAIAGRGEIGVALGGGQAAAHGLHLDDQVDQVFDRRLVLLSPIASVSASARPRVNSAFASQP